MISKLIKWGCALCRLILLKLIYRDRICFNIKDIKTIYIGKYSKIKLDGKSKLILGKNVYIDDFANIHTENDAILKIGDNVYFNEFCRIAAKQKITIGSNIIFGSNVCIFDHDHDIQYGVMNGIKNYICKPIYIDACVWCGANVVILKGSIINQNCVVGANSIVNKHLISGVWAGNPLKKIKEISSNDT